jgi:Gas vesicle synthesis protein GvpL/GvpF
MGWYVYGLVDARPSGRPARGLSGPLSVRAHAGVLVVVERRADVPPAEFGTLRKHQAAVLAIAARVPAIVPVRFGTLLEAEEIDEALEGRQPEIEEAFALVRGRVQFTWRRPRRTRNIVQPKPTSAGNSASPIGAGSDPGSGSAGGSGAAYLRRAARAAGGTQPPAAFRAPHESLAGLIVQQRYEPATAALPESLYHLVDRAAATRYRKAAAMVLRTTPALRMTGPWPPFAFVPEVL